MTERYFEYLTPILDNYITFEDDTKIQVADLVYNFGKMKMLISTKQFLINLET